MKIQLIGNICSKNKCPFYRSYSKDIYDGKKFGKCIASRCIENLTPLLDIWIEEFAPLLRARIYDVPKEGC